MGEAKYIYFTFLSDKTELFYTIQSVEVRLLIASKEQWQFILPTRTSGSTSTNSWTPSEITTANSPSVLLAVTPQLLPPVVLSLRSSNRSLKPGSKSISLWRLPPNPEVVMAASLLLI